MYPWLKYKNDLWEIQKVLLQKTLCREIVLMLNKTEYDIV